MPLWTQMTHESFEMLWQFEERLQIALNLISYIQETRDVPNVCVSPNTLHSMTVNLDHWSTFRLSSLSSILNLNHLVYTQNEGN